MTLLVRNVLILGGAREFPEPTDVFISGERISAIGNFPNKKADEVLDGGGAYLSPGFIDVNTDSDHYLSLLDYPAQEDFLKQGVTTIFGGMCGASLAPLLYGSLESVGKWTDPNRANVGWHTTAEFLRALDKFRLGVNFGTLAGHGTVRRAITGEALRELTKNELGVLAGTLREALREGAFGISTGLAYVHERSTPPGELKLVADIVKSAGGVYATHLRNMDKGVEKSVEETIALAKGSGARTLVSHFVPIRGAEREYSAALDLIESLPQSADFHFDLYPSEDMLLPIYSFLPEWAQNGGAGRMMANVKDEWFAKRVRADMPAPDEDRLIVAQAPGNDSLVGRSLREIKEMYEAEDSRDALIRLMVAMRMRGAVLYRNVNVAAARRAIASPHSFIASNAPSFAEAPFRGKQLKSSRTKSTFTDFLAMAEKENLMPLKDAVAKITSAPAAEFGLRDRGAVAEGYFADLACFKGGEIRFTVVNGKTAMKGGECGGAGAGKALRRAPRAAGARA